MRFARRAAISFGLVAAALSIQPAVTQATLSAQESGIALGMAAPGALVQTLDGRELDLKQYIGVKPVMFEFWATWCGNCKELMPSVVAATRKYNGKMTFVTVAVSVNQTQARVAAWHKQNHIATEMVYDLHGKASDAYDVPATSYVVLVNKAGRVVYTGVGGDQNLDAAIAKALK